MTWRRPNFPSKLSVGVVGAGFNRIQQRELGDTVKAMLAPLPNQSRAIKWAALEMRDLSRHRVIDRFDQDAFQMIFDDARALVDNECKALHDELLKVNDQILSLEKESDNEGAKKLLQEISEQLVLFSQALSKETLEEHIKNTREQHMAFFKTQIDQRFKRLKDAFAKIVKGIQKVIELKFDASSEAESVNDALTFGYSLIQNYIKDFSTYVEKGLWDIDIETFKNDLEPITKFAGDESLFAFSGYSEMYERDIKVIASDETESEDVKKHCITILQAVRALPSRYKE